MTRTITALHTLQDGQAVTNLGNLPGPDDYLTKTELLDMARQIHQHAIDAQRITETPVRHEMTPGYFEYPTFEESCDMGPSMLRGWNHDQ